MHWVVFEKNATAWKVSKYWVFSDLYFLVFGLNTEKYGPENTPYLDTFHAVRVTDWREDWKTNGKGFIGKLSVEPGVQKIFSRKSMVRRVLYSLARLS